MPPSAAAARELPGSCGEALRSCRGGARRLRSAPANQPPTEREHEAQAPPPVVVRCRSGPARGGPCGASGARSVRAAAATPHHPHRHRPAAGRRPRLLQPCGHHAQSQRAGARRRALHACLYVGSEQYAGPCRAAYGHVALGPRHAGLRPCGRTLSLRDAAAAARCGLLDPRHRQDALVAAAGHPRIPRHAARRERPGRVPLLHERLPQVVRPPRSGARPRCDGHRVECPRRGSLCAARGAAPDGVDRRPGRRGHREPRLRPAALPEGLLRPSAQPLRRAATARRPLCRATGRPLSAC